VTQKKRAADAVAAAAGVVVVVVVVLDADGDSVDVAKAVTSGAVVEHQVNRRFCQWHCHWRSRRMQLWLPSPSSPMRRAPSAGPSLVQLLLERRRRHQSSQRRRYSPLCPTAYTD